MRGNSGSSGLKTRSGVVCLLEFSRGRILMTISGESKVLPMELPYLRRIWSRNSSTTQSPIHGTNVADPPGLLTHILEDEAMSALTEAEVAAVTLPERSSPGLERTGVGSNRRLRGGCWDSGGSDCRRAASLGCRLAWAEEGDSVANASSKVLSD